MQDPLASSLSDYQQLASGLATLNVKNKDTCKLQKITNDFSDWCLEDKMRCVYATGIEDRVYNNAVGIVASIIDIGKGLFQDRTC